METLPQLVLISGITGFVGAATAMEFLKRGFNVRGTARNQHKADEFLDFYPEYHDSGRLQIVLVPDIVAPGAFDEAVVGVSIFAHTASPLSRKGKPGQWTETLLRPTINGTLEALKSAVKEPSVKKFVITSSVATLLFTNQDVLSEYLWNPTSANEAEKSDNAFFVYAASKTLAEQAAWNFMHTEKPQFTLTTLLPPYIYGPSSAPATKGKPFIHGTNDNIFYLLDPDFDISRIIASPDHVDVRDLAIAQVRAVSVPEAAGERILVCADGESTPHDWLAILQKKFPAKELAAPRLDFQFKPMYKGMDKAKATKILGMKFRPLEETVVDTAQFYYDLQ